MDEHSGYYRNKLVVLRESPIYTVLFTRKLNTILNNTRQVSWLASVVRPSHS
jgi:hypothetical protein